MADEPTTQEGLASEGSSPAPAGTPEGNQSPEGLASQQATSGVKGTPASPEADLGLKFKIEDVPEEQRQHVQKYVDQAKSALNTKMTEMAEKANVPPDQMVDRFNSLSFAEQQGVFNNLLKSQSFIGLAQQAMQQSGYQQQADVSGLQMNQVAQRWDSLPEDQKIGYWNQLEPSMQEILRVNVEQARQARQTQFLAQNQLEQNRQAEQASLTTKYGDDFKKRIPELRKMQTEQAGAGKAFTLDECYKIHSYEDAKKNSLEAGKDEREANITKKKEANVVGAGLPGETTSVGEIGSMAQAVEAAERQHGGKISTIP